MIDEGRFAEPLLGHIATATSGRVQRRKDGQTLEVLTAGREVRDPRGALHVRRAGLVVFHIEPGNRGRMYHVVYPARIDIRQRVGTTEVSGHDLHPPTA